ncbi:MAG: hypothetical protein ACLFVK_02190 [Dehalococcoidia bacterium]
MDGNEGKLSQGDIDALFAQAQGGGDAGSSSKSQPSPPSQQPPPQQTSQNAAAGSRDMGNAASSGGTSPEATNQFQQLAERIDSLENLAQRVDQVESLVTKILALSQQMEVATAKIERLETQIANMENAPQSAQQDIRPLVNSIKEIDAQLMSILKGLQGTVGYNLGQNFRCSSCGSQGFVAELVKCTVCGEESWWGWWPDD